MVCGKDGNSYENNCLAECAWVVFVLCVWTAPTQDLVMNVLLVPIFKKSADIFQYLFIYFFINNNNIICLDVFLLIVGSWPPEGQGWFPLASVRTPWAVSVLRGSNLPAGRTETRTGTVVIWSAREYSSSTRTLLDHDGDRRQSRGGACCVKVGNGDLCEVGVTKSDLMCQNGIDRRRWLAENVASLLVWSVGRTTYLAKTLADGFVQSSWPRLLLTIPSISLSALLYINKWNVNERLKFC